MAIYCYEIKKRIGAYAAALGGLDALVFSGGIGEHARRRPRRDLRAASAFLGVELDDAPQQRAMRRSSRPPTARVTVHVIPTDEEVVIARPAYRRSSRSDERS